MADKLKTRPLRRSERLTDRIRQLAKPYETPVSQLEDEQMNYRDASG